MQRVDQESTISDNCKDLLLKSYSYFVNLGELRSFYQTSQLLMQYNMQQALHNISETVSVMQHA